MLTRTQNELIGRILDLTCGDDLYGRHKKYQDLVGLTTKELEKILEEAEGPPVNLAQRF